MARLSDADYRAALDVLWEAGEVEGSQPFPIPVLMALRRLVPCDVVAYHCNVERRRTLTWHGEPQSPVTPAVREAAQRLAPLDPLQPCADPRKYSDLMSVRDYHRHPIYNELARPIGVDDMFRVWLEPDGARKERLEFDRPDWNFSDVDRAKLALVLPHLRQFARRAARRRAGVASDRVTPREREVLMYVARGHTNAEIARSLWISPGTVRKHLENAYDKLGVSTRTAAIAALSQGSNGAS
jgi:DNA-binding CsgD family transcriptional regulator